MALNGKIISLGADRYGFEFIDRMGIEPTEIRQVWEIASYRTSGAYFAMGDVLTRAGSITDGQVSCYLGNGSWFNGSLAQGGSTPSIIQETRPVPAPKVKAGTPTRWRDGRWEKQLTRGWVAA